MIIRRMGTIVIFTVWVLSLFLFAIETWTINKISNQEYYITASMAFASTIVFIGFIVWQMSRDFLKNKKPIKA